jgi:hypothetical protein
MYTPIGEVSMCNVKFELVLMGSILQGLDCDSICCDSVPP